MEKISKQVLIWRHDLKVRKGKIASQIAHASLASLFNATGRKEIKELPITINPKEDSAMHHWLTERFTKITCYVKDEKELTEIFQQVQSKGLPCALITDAGLTEFDGVPTVTCLGIGPCWAEEIDPITKHLPLL